MRARNRRRQQFNNDIGARPQPSHKLWWLSRAPHQVWAALAGEGTALAARPSVGGRQGQYWPAQHSGIEQSVTQLRMA